MTSLELTATPQKALSNWPLAISAGLLGIGQNGLLVAIPMLVAQTSLSLSVWAGLLTLGSMLFLPSSPWWGKQIARVGSKPVVLWSLAGYGASFLLLGIGCTLLSTQSISPSIGLGILIIARVIYGLMVSAMVPACQVWALHRAGEGKRMTALATISSGLSCGRLFGPPAVARNNARLRIECLPYLLCALLLAATVSLMQLGLSPALARQFVGDTAAISHQVAWLLSVAAIASLGAQFTVLRPQLLTPLALLLSAGLLMSLGLGMMLSPPLWLFYTGCALLSFGAALGTPAYQLLLNDKLADGAGAGWIATSHTLGYGLCALLVPLVSQSHGETALIGAAFAAALLFMAMSALIWRARRRSTLSAY